MEGKIVIRDIIETRAYIGGVWRNGAGEAVDSINPVDGSCVATVHHCTRDDVEEAIASACRAQTESGWLDMKAHERAKILHAVGHLIDRHGDDISRLQTLDTGKTLYETRALAASAANTFRFYAAALETLEDSMTPARGDYLTFSLHEPIGIVGAITPWNSPIASDAQKVAPALAAGNAVVLKPAEWTPLVSLLFARICEQAGVPKGLLSVLPGRGRDIGAAIVEHPGVGKVSFTGGTNTGYTIARAAAEKLMPISLELGGKSPTIVFEDADIDLAVAGIMFGIFSSTGQSCIAGSRLFVHCSIMDAFMERLVSATRALIVGRPDSSDTQVSSMVAHSHRDSVAAYVEIARSEGADILCGGEIPGGDLSSGAFYLPTILAGLSADSRVLKEEIFGPVLAVLPFENEEDLIAQANDSVYGLACGIWTEDMRRAWRVARKVEAGTVWVNTYKQFSISTPFGGWKLSGMGTEKGREGIRNFQRQKGVYIGMGDAPIAWARLT
ncbi:aldehyde dehydrogenase [Hyphomonas pacifica]|nr:aldehyde dehydrogenase [Hyphomonas pacifica]